MTRDVAIRIDSRITSIGTSLAALSQFIRKYCSEADGQHDFLLCVGKSTAELIEISNRLYAMYPDIRPPEAG